MLFFVQDDGAGRDAVTMTDVIDAQLHQIASPEFAIKPQINP